MGFEKIGCKYFAYRMDEDVSSILEKLYHPLFFKNTISNTTFRCPGHGIMKHQDWQIRIGKEIRKFRCMNEMTQEQVAEKLHLDRNAYGEIERGKTDIHLSRLVQIANFFGVDAGEFFETKQKAVFYVTGTSNTQTHNQCNEYYSDSEEIQILRNELDKAQLELEFMRKELRDKQRIIELLEEKVSGK